MKTNTDINLMIARLEGRIEGTSRCGGDTHLDEKRLEALLWVMDGADKL